MNLLNVMIIGESEINTDSVDCHEIIRQECLARNAAFPTTHEIEIGSDEDDATTNMDKSLHHNLLTSKISCKYLLVKLMTKTWQNQ